MIDSKVAIDLYKKTYLIRRVEETISENYFKNKMRCPVHLSIGQEACAVGVCNNLKTSDLIISTHRAHAHYLAKNGSLQGLLSELHGNLDGCASGLGGSMHLQDEKAGVVASVPIVGSTIPIGVGLALSNSLKKNNKVVTVFFGEGATEEGVFYESLNFAVIHNLKILFVCENNFYSVYTSLLKRQPFNRNLKKIVKGLGMDYNLIDGQDVINIKSKSEIIIEKIRNKNQPFFLELKTYRYLEHCGPNNDDLLNYRPKKELEFWKNKCPIKILENKLLKFKILNTNRIKQIKSKINNKILNEFQRSEKEIKQPKDILKNINFA
jgi:TPP-dependent pyruvate/acetoin dehydrogenase alpha subunit